MLTACALFRIFFKWASPVEHVSEKFSGVGKGAFGLSSHTNAHNLELLGHNRMNVQPDSITSRSQNLAWVVFPATLTTLISENPTSMGVFKYDVAYNV